MAKLQALNKHLTLNKRTNLQTQGQSELCSGPNQSWRTHQLLTVFICLNITRLQRHLSSCTKHSRQANVTLSWKTWLYPCVILSFFPSQKAHFRSPLLLTLVVKTWSNKRDVSCAATRIFRPQHTADSPPKEPVMRWQTLLIIISWNPWICCLLSTETVLFSHQCCRLSRLATRQLLMSCGKLATKSQRCTGNYVSVPSK